VTIQNTTATIPGEIKDVRVYPRVLFACYSMVKFSTMPLAAWDSLTWGLENKHMMV
jgi:hypothetical protein